MDYWEQRSHAQQGVYPIQDTSHRNSKGEIKGTSRHQNNMKYGRKENRNYKGVKYQTRHNLR